MITPLKVTSEYSLLKSLIKIPDLIKYLKENNIKSCALVDDELFGVMEFYLSCKDNGNIFFFMKLKNILVWKNFS